ncbi:copper homeostasis membrane protein CopD [Labrys okinawensis]|uniref:copper homeostasis membrane protein CopD n=1 Tax=Labrys okinawensis TaxID=346911 RepID=UPI0039BD20A6
MSPDTALALCRFLHDASVMLLWGGCAYLAWLVPRELAEAVGRRLRTLTIVAVAVAVATVLLALPLETAEIGEGWNDAIDLETIHDVLFGTTVGSAWMAQFLCALVLAGAALVRWRARLVAMAVASGLLLASLALTGHAVMQSGWTGAGHIANDIVHVLAGGAWLGALIPLLPVLAALSNPARRSDAGRALRRFSNVGHAAVALVLASGLINTLLILGHLPLDWSSPYQQLLTAKIVLVAVMTGLAIVNRYVFVPMMKRSRINVTAALRFATIAEIALGLGAIGAVSVFGMLEPQ